jgi:hypothetical protein
LNLPASLGLQNVSCWKVLGGSAHARAEQVARLL